MCKKNFKFSESRTIIAELQNMYRSRAYVRAEAFCLCRMAIVTANVRPKVAGNSQPSLPAQSETTRKRDRTNKISSQETPNYKER